MKWCFFAQQSERSKKNGRASKVQNDEIAWRVEAKKKGTKETNEKFDTIMTQAKRKSAYNICDDSCKKHCRLYVQSFKYANNFKNINSVMQKENSAKKKNLNENKKTNQGKTFMNWRTGYALPHTHTLFLSVPHTSAKYLLKIDFMLLFSPRSIFRMFRRHWMLSHTHWHHLFSDPFEYSSQHTGMSDAIWLSVCFFFFLFLSS